MIRNKIVLGKRAEQCTNERKANWLEHTLRQNVTKVYFLEVRRNQGKLRTTVTDVIKKGGLNREM